MIKNTLCLLMLFFISGVVAQQNLDSLYMVWIDKSMPDSSRIKAFDDYIWDGYLYSDTDTALILAKSLYNFTVENYNKKGEGNTLNLIGVAKMMKGNYGEAVEDYEKSLGIWEELDNKLGIANAYGNIGLAHTYKGNYKVAVDYFKKSLDIKIALDNKMGISNSLGNIGMVYVYLGDYSMALKYYRHGLDVKMEIDDKRGIAVALNNIGQILLEQKGEYHEALKLLKQSLEIREDLNDVYGVATTLNNIANVYYQLKDNDQALKTLKRSILLMEEIGFERGKANALAFLGDLYIDQKNYNKAITSCNESLVIARKINNLIDQKDACECLYLAYKTIGKNKMALVYHEKMLIYQDSLKTEESAKKLQQMEFAKEVLKDSLLQVEKELQVEMAHQVEVRKKDRNRNIALGAGIFFLVLSGGFFSRWRYVKKSKKIIEKEKDRSENLLLNILPSEIAEELKQKGSVDARDFDQISVLFTDFKGFTTRSEKLSARELVKEINLCFKAFDYICEKYKIEKIKTIGDAYMAAGGLPIPKDDAVKNTVLAALEMQAFVGDRVVELRANNEVPFEMRVGIHTGPVVAGIVGVKKFQYDIWGDTVNTASRMESSGEIGKVNISEATYEIIKEDPMFAFTKRGKIQAKGKGVVEMYFVTKVD